MINKILNKRTISLMLCIVLAVSLFAGCANIKDENVALAGAVTAGNNSTKISDKDLAVVTQTGAPAVATTLMPVASGTKVLSNSVAQIDASNISDGYVMVKYLKNTTLRLKVLITGPSGVKYQYNLNSKGEYDVFPLSDGNGSYTIGVYKNISGSRYSTEYSASVNVSLKDEFAPFLLPNQYVNYTMDSKTVEKAKELTKNSKTTLQSINAVYSYVVKNISYDRVKASTVKSGYLSNVDEILESKKGICLDYAAVMTAMLRSQGIPCKLVVGNAGTAYHAWINAYSEETGWMNTVIYFDGVSWKLMDPTFASTGKQSAGIMNYIGNGKNYTAKYLY